MTYTNLYNGSSGDDVRRMQEELQAKGYNIGSTGADGIYGWNTQQAVRQYQQDNGLDVDGVAGNQTLTHLYGNGTAAQQQTGPEAGADGTGNDGNVNSVLGDPAYQQAIQALTSVNDRKPAYNPGFDSQIMEIYNQIVNKEPFKYDLDSDMLYQQYRQQYTDLGQLAMQDAMGQAAALTGGYGSTYGQAVGQQQYDLYLQQLNNIIPDLYDRAYNIYRGEGDDMMAQYSMLTQMQNNDYGRYQDALDSWQNDRNYAQAIADQAYDRGLDDRDDARNRIAQYLSGGGDITQLPADLISASGLTQPELDALAGQYAPKGRGGGSGGQNPNEGTGFTKDQVKAIQRSLGLPVTGIWDEETAAAYNGKKVPPENKPTYNTAELLDAAAAGMKKSEIEAVLTNRGVNINDPAVQADIKWAMSK